MLYFQYFNQLRENIIRSQPPDKQAAMAQWFENLMDGIERNLLTKNRDRLVSYDRPTGVSHLLSLKHVNEAFYVVLILVKISIII
jgi:hypothetical protein